MDFKVDFVDNKKYMFPNKGSAKKSIEVHAPPAGQHSISRMRDIDINLFILFSNDQHNLGNMN